MIRALRRADLIVNKLDSGYQLNRGLLKMSVYTKTLEEVLAEALKMLEMYPNNVECLAEQINLITKACALEADENCIEYGESDPRIANVV